jgi:hypothetical protein
MKAKALPLSSAIPALQGPGSIHPPSLISVRGTVSSPVRFLEHLCDINSERFFPSTSDLGGLLVAASRGSGTRIEQSQATQAAKYEDAHEDLPVCDSTTRH